MQYKLQITRQMNVMFYVPNDYFIVRIAINFLVNHYRSNELFIFSYIAQKNNASNSKIFILSPVLIEKSRIFFPMTNF